MHKIQRGGLALAAPLLLRRCCCAVVAAPLLLPLDTMANISAEAEDHVWDFPTREVGEDKQMRKKVYALPEKQTMCDMSFGESWTMVQWV